jgi:predicted transcriptional regulator
MPEKWTGRLVGRMHNEMVSQDDMAEELGVTKAYVSMILHGRRKPDGIRERMETAFESVISKRKDGLHDC